MSRHRNPLPPSDTYLTYDDKMKYLERQVAAGLPKVYLHSFRGETPECPNCGSLEAMLWYHTLQPYMRQPPLAHNVYVCRNCSYACVAAPPAE